MKGVNLKMRMKVICETIRDRFPEQIKKDGVLMFMMLKIKR
jgi:hypothetical protein